MILKASKDIPTLCHVDSNRYLNIKWSGGIILPNLKAKNIYTIINHSEEIICHLNNSWYTKLHLE